jgi:hypothetical protein
MSIAECYYLSIKISELKQHKTAMQLLWIYHAFTRVSIKILLFRVLMALIYRYFLFLPEEAR